MPIILKKIASYALSKGGQRAATWRRLSQVLTLTLAVSIMLLSAREMNAQEPGSASVAGPIRTFAAYQPNLNAFPFTQPGAPLESSEAIESTQQSPNQAPADKPSGLPDEPGAKPETKAADCAHPPCKPKPPIVDWYMHFVTGPTPKVLTPRDKAFIAVRGVIDPFNIITILGEGAISVAADSHSAYGPGFPGFARYVGVSFTEDITGEFFNTFLIPSLTHQDPRYHRMPQASMAHRIAHAIYQVAWTQSDYGKGMLNYGNLVGFAIDDEIGNLYVPGRRTNASATAQRYAIGLATAPIDNFVSEFLPDVAKHVHVQIVVVQRIINHIAGTDNNAL